MTKKSYTRLALVVSILAMILWSAMGTGTSLAWFVDADADIKNVFHFADFDLEVEYRTEGNQWKSIDGETRIFDDAARYEPGYVQVVFLRVTNKGDVPFDFKTAVSVTDYTVATNYFGSPFLLQDYLRFGLVNAGSEEEMDSLVATRELARACATERLSNYSTNKAELQPEETVYMALVVHMPEKVDNVANYRGEVIPRVELGIIVTATQQGTPEEATP